MDSRRDRVVHTHVRPGAQPISLAQSRACLCLLYTSHSCGADQLARLQPTLFSRSFGLHPGSLFRSSYRKEDDAAQRSSSPWLAQSRLGAPVLHSHRSGRRCVLGDRLCCHGSSARWPRLRHSSPHRTLLVAPLDSTAVLRLFSRLRFGANLYSAAMAALVLQLSLRYGATPRSRHLCLPGCSVA